MSLRKQTLLLYGIILGLVAFFAYTLSRNILLKNYQDLERQQVETNTRRVINIIQTEIDQLSLSTVDWANWDDTYQFVQQPNEAYIASNFSLASLSNLELDLVLILDDQGQLVFSQGLDYETHTQAPIPEDFLAYFQADSELLNMIPEEGGVVQGLLATSQGPAMISMRPILTSQEEGPAAGVLVFGRYLDDSAVQHLAQRLEIPVSIWSFLDPALPDFQRSAIDHLPVNQSVWVEPVDAERAAGYGRMDDLLGRPAALVETVQGRAIFREGTRSVTTFLVIATCTVLAIFLVTAYMLEKRVLSRLRLLHAGMRTIQTTQNLEVEIPVGGNDELSDLAGGLRAMLAELARSRQALEDANRKLEGRVAQRTQALEETNRLLVEEVADRKLAQAELAQARDQAMDALRLKAQILANISHDARTPLNVIMLQADIMRAQVYGPLTAQQRELLVSIRESTRQLTEFMNSLLEESQANAGRLTLHREPFNPQELLEQVSSALLPLASRKSLELRTFLQPGMPGEVIGDQLRLEQILNNLVGNAIKFTESGYVEVRISRPNDGAWQIEVEDSGPGVAPENRERIFDPFWQVDGSIARKEMRGVGLGLSIVRQLVTVMRGTISVSDNPNAEHGSLFTIKLPLVVFDSGKWREASMTKRILVVEDDPVLGKLFRDILAMSEWEVEWIEEGAPALEHILDQPPDILLLDLHLPEVSGVEILNAVRDEPRLPGHAHRRSDGRRAARQDAERFGRPGAAQAGGHDAAPGAGAAPGLSLPAKVGWLKTSL